MKSVLAFLALHGCSSFAIGAADRSSLVSATLVESCPLGVPWTNVAQKPTPNGVEVTFSSREPSRVDELRERVRDQAHAYGPNLHRGIGHDGTHEGPQNHGLRLWTMGALSVQSTDTVAGATLTIAPVDPTRAAEVRSLVARRVADLTSTGCEK